MVEAKVWVIRNKPDGLPKEEDFKMIKEALPECKEGDVIIEAEYLSVDPYMRSRIRQTEVNGEIQSRQVARVVESRNEDYPIGTYVFGYSRWRTHTHLTREQFQTSAIPFPYMKVPDLGDLPKSTALGVCGMPGITAYFGLLEICDPKPGETVLVNGAAGAVGSYVCQIAKIKECKVIAFAGSEDKVSWLKEIGVDHVFNYKTTDVKTVLKETAPNGINCYFDNVGGEFTAAVMPHMADFGRIAVCGAISTYNDEIKQTSQATLTSPFSEMLIVRKQLRLEGFLVLKWKNRYLEGVRQLKEWVTQGKIKYRETITTGFEGMPRAFIGLFRGDNFGKAIVHI